MVNAGTHAAASRDIAPQGVLAAVNAARAGQGLPPVTWNPRLAAAAAHHGADLQRCGQFGHIGCDGSDLATRLQRAGFAYRHGAENIAVCACDATDVVWLWMGSDGHRRNLLSPVVTEIGADMRTDTGDPRRTLWVLVLGHPAPE